jgi:Holliday junction resolvasome RuvABC endonuclease subunit
LNVLGIDPSSTLCGVALIRDGNELYNTWTWKKDKSKSGAQNIYNYFVWLTSQIETLQLDRDTRPDIACVEFLSVERNATTARKVSHFQAASVLACKSTGLLVIEGRVSSARKEAFGEGWGNVKKEVAHEEIKKMYPNHKFKGVKSGGFDETDAVVLALAGPGLAER